MAPAAESRGEVIKSAGYAAAAEAGGETEGHAEEAAGRGVCWWGF